MRPRTIEIHEAVSGRNDEIAARNRARFEQAGVFVINVMSAPGSGKTEFLARTLADVAAWGPSPYTIANPSSDRAHHPTGQGRPSATESLAMAVIVGDIATDNDARRLNLTGAEAIQITTGGYCHLDASMIAEAIDGMNLGDLDVLIIENVGNLVCPATFDLGEHARIALLSVTEGEDKPLKYPTLFKRAEAIVINKIDLADAVAFQREIALENLRRVAPQALIFEVSARTGKGMQVWYEYLRDAAIKGREIYSHA